MKPRKLSNFVEFSFRRFLKIIFQQNMLLCMTWLTESALLCEKLSLLLFSASLSKMSFGKTFIREFLKLVFPIKMRLDMSLIVSFNHLISTIEAS